MVLALVTAVSEITPLPAGPSLETKVILWVFLIAAFLFLLFWGIRSALGKTSFSPPGPLLAPDPETPALPLPAPAHVGEDGSPYQAPLSPSLAPQLPQATGLAKYFKVPVAHYRLLDLPLIGLVFLIYCGLTTGNGGGGGESLTLEQKYSPLTLVLSMFFHILLMGMACAFVARRIKQSEWLGLRWKQWWLAFAIAPVCLLFMWFVLGAAFFSGWNSWLERTLGSESMQESVQVLKEVKDPLVIVLMGIAAVIVAPVAEEIVFRGYLYPASKRFCGPWGAMLFSSLVFAAAHGSAIALGPLFILAILLCLVYELTGSIWANISIHFLFNAATVTLQLLDRYGILDLQSPK